MPVTAFISYSHADEGALERLHKHMAVLKREGTLVTWSDHAIVPGDSPDNLISDQLDRSQVFLALISPDYLASGYCYDREFRRAQELAAQGRMRIVPLILEPCDWLSSPFKDYLALPKDGKPVSGFANPNVAYLDVVSGLRRVVDASYSPTTTLGAAPASANARRPRIKQDFDTIQKAEYADRAFAVIRDYFRSSCAEMAQVDDLRARFEEMDATAFTCSVVNRARQRGGEAHITVHATKSRNHGFGGDINYVYQRHAERNTSNGAILVANDDYQMFLTMDRFGMSSGRDEARVSPEQAAERLWDAFVGQAGIEYG